MESGLIHIPYSRPGRTASEVFNFAVEVAREADAAGFTEMMITEHATQLWENIPNPELVIAAAARETKNIKFAPMAHLLPHHHPANLAIQVGWLSQVLEGRYFLGVGAGAYRNSAILHGLPDDMSQNAEMVRESLYIMERVWKREPFRYKGKFWDAGFPEEPKAEDGDDSHRLSNFAPWGGKLEIAVTGLSKNSSSIKFAGERGYSPVSIFSGSSVLKTHWETYEKAALENGHVPDRGRYRVSQEVFVAETDKEAKRRAIEGPMGYCWDHYLLPIYKRFGLIDGYLQDVGAHISDVDLNWLADHVWVVGSPATVREKLEKLFDITGGWGVLQVQTHDYMDDPAPWYESLHAIAKDVAPFINLVNPVKHEAMAAG